MSEQPENFDQLLRLLALKKYEQPPVDYFDQLSEEIASRLVAETAEPEMLIDPIPSELGWVGKLWALLEARPALVGACGVAASGLVLWGILSAPRLPQTPGEAARLGEFTAPFPAADGPAFATVALVPTNDAPVISPQLPPGFFDTLYQREQSTPVMFKQP